MRERWMVVGGILVGLGVTPGLAADEIELANGDRLVGSVIEQTDEKLVFEHELLGIVEIDLANVALIEVDEPDAVAPEAPPVEPPAAADEPAPESAWNSIFDLGLGGSFGNTDTQSINAAITSSRETEAMRTALDLKYFFGSTDGDRTDNRFTAGILNDWLIPGSPWFYFASARYDNDEFQSWNYRLGLHGGVGYQLIDEEDLKFALRAGAGAVHEWGSEDDGWRPEALLGADLDWQITETQSLTARTVIFPDLEEGGEFRAVSSVAWRALLDEEAKMNFNIRFEHEHQSLVDPGVDRNDFRIAAGLGFEF